jgi:predicted DCC family thiol-disulfide oxidoreductase YuxK
MANDRREQLICQRFDAANSLIFRPASNEAGKALWKKLPSDRENVRLQQTAANLLGDGQVILAVVVSLRTKSRMG